MKINFRNNENLLETHHGIKPIDEKTKTISNFSFSRTLNFEETRIYIYYLKHLDS
jgi:hypothetical protein